MEEVNLILTSQLKRNGHFVALEGRVKRGLVKAESQLTPLLGHICLPDCFLLLPLPKCSVFALPEGVLGGCPI